MEFRKMKTTKRPSLVREITPGLPSVAHLPPHDVSYFRQIRKLILVLSLALVFIFSSVPRQALAADGDGPGPSSGPRRHLATIIFSGLGGAVLGLSTLSFYGRPQDNLSNIGVGFALGIIAGTAYVTYQIVKTPTEMYGQEILPRDPNDHSLWTEPTDRKFFELTERRPIPAPISISQFNWSF